MSENLTNQTIDVLVNLDLSKLKNKLKRKILKNILKDKILIAIDIDLYDVDTSTEVISDSIVTLDSGKKKKRKNKK